MNQEKGAHNILIYPKASPSALWSSPSIFLKLYRTLGCLGTPGISWKLLLSMLCICFISSRLSLNIKSAFGARFPCWYSFENSFFGQYLKWKKEGYNLYMVFTTELRKQNDLETGLFHQNKMKWCEPLVKGRTAPPSFLLFPFLPKCCFNISSFHFLTKLLRT